MRRQRDRPPRARSAATADEPHVAAAFLTAALLLAVAAAVVHTRPAAPSAAAATAAVLAGLVVAYALDPTLGLPLAAEHGATHARSLDSLGLATKTVELFGAAAAVSLLFRRRRVAVRSDPPA